MSISNPHDKFVKEVISSPQNAIEIIKSGLLPEISEKIDWSSLHRENGTFIDEEMKELQSDALFSVRTKKKSNLNFYILFEHKSYPDKSIYVQLGSYLWQIYTKQKERVLVLPFVLYHGKNKWQVKGSFIDEFNLDGEDLNLFSRFIPDFSFSLLNLPELKVENLEVSIYIKSVFFALKYIWVMNSKETLTDFIRLAFDLFFEEKSEENIEKLLIYLYTSTEVEPQELETIIAEVISSEKAGIAMSTAELLERKGIEKREREIVLNMHSKDFDNENIAEVTNLSIGQIEKIIEEN